MNNWTEVMGGLEIDLETGDLRTVGPTRDLLREAAFEIRRLRSHSGHLRIGDQVKVVAVSGGADDKTIRLVGVVDNTDLGDEHLPYRVQFDRFIGGTDRWWFASIDLELIPPTIEAKEEPVPVGTPVCLVRNPPSTQGLIGQRGMIRGYDGSDRMAYLVTIANGVSYWCNREDFEVVPKPEAIKRVWKQGDKPCPACGGVGSTMLPGERNPEPCLACSECGIVKIDKEKVLNPEALTDFQRTIGEWGNKTFPKSTPASILNHLKREVEELREAEYRRPPRGSDSAHCVQTEVADCFLLLLHYCYQTQINMMAAALGKFEINKAREWGEIDSEGVVEHIRE